MSDLVFVRSVLFYFGMQVLASVPHTYKLRSLPLIPSNPQILKSSNATISPLAINIDTDIGIPTSKTKTTHHAAEVVGSFLDMHRLSSNVCRSWAFVHNAVSCAFTLRSFGATGDWRGIFWFLGRLVCVLEQGERMSDGRMRIRTSGVSGLIRGL